MPRLRPALSNFGDERRIVMPDRQKYSRVRSGSFSKVKGSYNGEWTACEWVFCREYFLDESQGIRRMLFSHKKDKSYSVAAFIDRVEQELRIKPRSDFGPTQRSTVTWIRVSSFWSTSSMKRSLFTALLRCGVNYRWTKGNLNEALTSVQYTRMTESAVNRFLSGHTRYTGNQRGWYSQFRWGSGTSYRPSSPNEEQMKKLLVKPR
jgi:hypothetical protein